MAVLGILRVLMTADSEKFKSDMKSSQKVVTDFKSQIGSMAKVLAGAFSVGAVVSGIKNIASETSTYAKSVEDLSRSLGIGTEEASKLLQMTDDLEISQGSLEQGMKNALRQGIMPNVEGMKDLARQYQELQTPAEKAAFAMKTFGKNGLEMAKILEKTPDQIQEMADALEGSSLIMGEDAVQAAKDYRVAMDNLDDSVMGLKISVGNELLPVLADAANDLGELITVNQRAETTEQNLKKAVELGIISRQQYKEAMDGVFTSAVFGKISVENLAKAEDYLKTNVGLVTHEVSIGMGNLREYEGGIRDLAGAADDAAQANDDLKYAIMDVGKAALGKEALDALAEAYDKDEILVDEYRARTADVMTNWLGMPAAEVQAALALQDAREAVEDGMGTWMGYYDIVKGTSNELEYMNGKHFKTYFEVVTEGTNFHYVPPTGGTVGGASSGSSAGSRPGTTPTPTGSTRPRERGGQFGLDMDVPSGYPNDSYPIRASSGEHVTITPRGEAQFDEKKLARAIRDALLQVMQ